MENIEKINIIHNQIIEYFKELDITIDKIEFSKEDIKIYESYTKFNDFNKDYRQKASDNSTIKEEISKELFLEYQKKSKITEELYNSISFVYEEEVQELDYTNIRHPTEYISNIHSLESDKLQEISIKRTYLWYYLLSSLENYYYSESLCEAYYKQESLKTSKDSEISLSSKSETYEDASTVSNIEKEIKNVDKGYYLDIPALVDNPIHQYLKSHKLYQLFYSCWRMKFDGGYKEIPTFFLLFFYNYSRYNNKITTKELANIGSLSYLEFGASGNIKSEKVTFLEELISHCLGYNSSASWMGTSASIRGSVDFDTKHSYKSEIINGSMSKCIMYSEEMKTLFKKSNREPEMQILLFSIGSGKPIDGNQKGTKAFAKYLLRWEKTLIDMQIEIENENDVKKKKELIKLYEQEAFLPGGKIPRFDLDNNYWKLSGDNYEEVDIQFKAKAAHIMVSTPIQLEHKASSEEVALQKSLGFGQGLYNRFWFCYNNVRVEDNVKAIYKQERITFLTELNVKYGKQGSVLMKEYFDDIKNVINSYPTTELNIEELDMIDYVYTTRKFYTPERLEILNNINNSLFDLMEGFETRSYYTQTKSLLVALTYFSKIKKPSIREIELVAKITNQSFDDYKNYIEDCSTIEKNSKYIETIDYEKAIMSSLCNKISAGLNNQDILDYMEYYPTTKDLLFNTENSFNRKYNGWSLKSYNNARKNLESRGIIKYYTKHPESNQGFGSGIRKVGLITKINNKIYLVKTFKQVRDILVDIKK